MTERDEINLYYDGVRDGLRRHAWWTEKTQMVGTCGTTLQEALERTEAERARALREAAFA